MKTHYLLKKKHYLKNPSSFIVVVLRSLMHRACVNCGAPIKSFEESSEHWEKELKKEGYVFEKRKDDGTKRLNK